MRRSLLPLGVLALIAIGAAWFHTAFERVSVREWMGPSGEGRRNPYLAAERFALRMGLPTRELRSLPELDTLKRGSVLLAPNRRQALDPRRMREIVSWVEAGGHLIVEAEFIGVADPLLELLEVHRMAAAAQGKPAEIQLPGARKLAVSIFGGMTLQAPGKEPARFVSFEHGEGRVSAFSGLHFARNSVIGTNDNAEFFWQLLRLTPAQELQLYRRPERLSLWGFLIEHAAAALFAGAVLVALWLWRLAPRYGPVPPDAAPARRRLLEHLRASGRYWWGQGLRGHLVIGARDAALRRIARGQPDFATAPQEERIARLCALAGLAPEEAERFLSAGGAVRGADFIRIVHTAQRIHSVLERGNR